MTKWQFLVLMLGLTDGLAYHYTTADDKGSALIAIGWTLGVLAGFILGRP